MIKSTLGGSMDNFFDILNSFSKSQDNKNDNNIPKEVIDQYPYGQFPLRYTKSGQEIIRKQSESRYLYDSPSQSIQNNNPPPPKDDNSLNLSLLLPIIQMLSGGKKSSKDMLGIFSKLLFKDNPDMQKLFSMLPNIKSQELSNEDNFPTTNKVQISSLKKIE